MAASRTTMQTLVDRIRNLTNVGASDYTVGATTYWDDDHLQTVLDRHQTFVIDHTLTWAPELRDGGTVNYLTAVSGYRNWEKTDGGTARFVIRQTVGTIESSTNYTPDYENGRVTWSSTQGGTVTFMIVGYSYDIYAAAIDVLEQRLAYVDYWYDFEADNQTFTRSQVIANLNNLIAQYRLRVGDNVKTAKAGNLKLSQMVRVDI